VAGARLASWSMARDPGQRGRAFVTVAAPLG